MALDLRHLRHVLAVDQHRNFARAAEALGLTQPALSRSIQALEETLGARIFDRDRTSVEPTAVGSRLIDHARPLVARAREIERDIELMIGLEGGLLRVGAGPYAAEISVGTAIGRLARRHPKILIDLAVADWPDLVRRVLAGTLDFAVCEASHALEDPRLTVEELPEHQALLFCRAGHPLAGKPGVTLEDVAAYPMVMTTIPRRLVALIGRNESRPSSDLPEGLAATEIRVETLSLARRIVMESDAVSVAVPAQIAPQVTLGQIVALPLDLPWLRTRYGVIRLANRTPPPAAVEFLRLLREVENSV